MTRKFKFRAWYKPTMKMIYFDELWFCNEYASLCFGNNHLKVNGLSDVYDPEDIGDVNEETNYEVMDFTGIKDIAGVDIYREDMVELGKRNFKAIGIVTWDIERCGYCVINVESGEKYDMEWTLEVIGNKYENPELLNGK